MEAHLRQSAIARIQDLRWQEILRSCQICSATAMSWLCSRFQEESGVGPTSSVSSGDFYLLLDESYRLEMAVTKTKIIFT
ncbi:hypothetical protein J6590_051539 [Homalodisca vitripennis]|nr:hypothetical protein J6590_051539 [Homalodisca vitripennis]